jgi:hypothetical protein
MVRSFPDPAAGISPKTATAAHFRETASFRRFREDARRRLA